MAIPERERREAEKTCPAAILWQKILQFEEAKNLLAKPNSPPIILFNDNNLSEEIQKTHNQAKVIVVGKSGKMPETNQGCPRPGIIIANYLSNFLNLISDLPSLRESGNLLEEGGIIFLSTPPLLPLRLSQKFIISMIPNAKLIKSTFTLLKEENEKTIGYLFCLKVGVSVRARYPRKRLFPVLGC